MALRISDEDYEKEHPELNPGQEDYNQKFNGLNKAEEKGNADNNSSSSDSDLDKIKNGEENPDNGFKDNFTPEREATSKEGQSQKGAAMTRLGRWKGTLKKKGPLTTIILTVVGGGIGIGGLLSPGLLIVNLKEVMVSKFNTQLASMDVRTKQILKSKMTSAVGVCGSVINIKCKYSSMSNKQIERFKKAGIDVELETDASKNIVGRSKVKSINFEGKTINADTLVSELNTNPKFSFAVKKAYNPLFAGFSDSVFGKLLSTRLRISKDGVKLEGTDDDAKLKSIQEETKSPSPIEKTSVPAETKDKDGNPTNKAAIDDANKVNNAVEEVTKGADEVATTGEKSFGKAIAKSKGFTSLFKITGVADTACTIYGTVRAIGFAAKTVRAVQLARYAMLFLKIADQIKAGGNPDPADVAYLGGVLTADVVSTVKDIKGNNITLHKSATDSFGYKYAAYGEKGIMSQTASQFMAGGGLTGDLIKVTSFIDQVLGKTPTATCRFLNNGFVSVGSEIAGIAAAIGSGGVSIGIMDVAIVAANIAVQFLPGLLKDMVAGVLVDKTTVGELAGDAITSGASGTMGSSAAAGGNAPLTVDQAIAYQDLSNNIASQYAAEDRLAYSPFDITNGNTFMGTLLSRLIPTLSKAASLPSFIVSLSSLALNPLASLGLNNASAAEKSDFTMCDDPDYTSMGLAADPYCNPVYGIPPDTLNIDPNTVLDKLLQGSEIDSTTGAPTDEFATFMSECGYMERAAKDLPIGSTGSDFQSDSGKNCMIKSDNTRYPNAPYYYLYQIDQRVSNGMDGEDSVLNAAMDKGMNADIAFYDGSNGINNNSNIGMVDTYTTPEINIDDKTTNINPSVVYNYSLNNTCETKDYIDNKKALSYLCNYSYLTPNYILDYGL